MAGEVDAGVGGGVALQGGDDLGVGGAVVDEAELPVGVGLVADGGDGLLEHVQRWVVDGGEHRDQRSRRRRSESAAGCGGGRRGRRGGARGVDEGRLQPDRARDVLAAVAPGSDGVRRQSCSAVRRGRDGAVDAWPRGRPRSAAAQHAGPELAARARRVSVTVTDARTAPRPSRQSWGSSIARAGERRRRRPAPAGYVTRRAGGDHQRAAEHAVGMQQPVRRRRRGVQPRPQRRQRHALAGAVAAGSEARGCGRGRAER